MIDEAGQERSGWTGRKSTYSQGANGCVEVDHKASSVGIRDTKDATRTTLAVTIPGFAHFLAYIRS